MILRCLISGRKATWMSRNTDFARICNHPFPFVYNGCIFTINPCRRRMILAVYRGA